MQIISKDEYNLKKHGFLEKIRQGAVFIYPTDTIYGIGANALNHDAIKRIRETKQRYTMPFSVIAPSKEWIRDNCEVDERVEEWINKLPGPYTLILKIKNNSAVEQTVNPNLDTIGVRIPNHWISDVAKELEFPIVTTSANVATKEFMTSPDNLDVEIRNKTDFLINEGEIKGKPSTIVDLTKEEVEIKERK